MSSNRIPLPATVKLDIEAFNDWLYTRIGKRVDIPETVCIYAYDDTSYAEPFYLFTGVGYSAGEMPARFVILPPVTLDFGPLPFDEVNT